MTKEEMRSAVMADLGKQSAKSRHAGKTREEISQHYSDLRTGKGKKRKRA
jgi:hypothetical protein